MKIRLVVVTLAALCGTLAVNAAPQPESARAPESVTLSYFRVVPDSDGIGAQLEWGTSSEIDTAGFHVYRATVEGVHGPGERINPSLLPGCGGCPNGLDYTWDDNGAEPGVGYYYWLGAVDIFGSEVYEQTTEGPRPFTLAGQAPTAINTAPPPTNTSQPNATATTGSGNEPTATTQPSATSVPATVTTGATVPPGTTVAPSPTRGTTAVATVTGTRLAPPTATPVVPASATAFGAASATPGLPGATVTAQVPPGTQSPLPTSGTGPQATAGSATGLPPASATQPAEDRNTSEATPSPGGTAVAQVTPARATAPGRATLPPATAVPRQGNNPLLGPGAILIVVAAAGLALLGAVAWRVFGGPRPPRSPGDPPLA